MKDTILLNNLFNGKYIEENIGGEIINIYQSDNGNYYVYANPYGNISKKWDNKIEYVLFIRSVGNGVVKITAKAKIEEHINPNSIFSKENSKQKLTNQEQKKYIDNNDIKYGGVKLNNLGSWSEYFLTFKAETIHKAKTDIYLATNDNLKDFTILKGINKINNQSQKLYIEATNDNYKILKDIIENKNLWNKEPVEKVNDEEKRDNCESFLSIIKKENDELVNSNLLSYFLENDEKFWSDFVIKVLKITDKNIVHGKPKITRESVGNIDLLIKIGGHAIVIENKIKSGINGRENNGYSQLEKYVKIADEYCKKNSILKLHFYILRPDYNNEEYKAFNKGEKYKEIKYSNIYEIIENRESGFYFDEFKKVVKKHSSEYDNELFEIMNERFIKQIKKNNK